VLTYTVTTYTVDWSEVIIDYLPSEFGNLTIKFATISDGNDKSMCFTNIKFYIKPTTGGGGAPVPTTKIVTYNSLKNTNIYGTFNVNDYINGGSKIEGIIRCPKIIVNKTDINENFYTGNVRASSAVFINNINISTAFTTGTLNTTTLNLNGVNTSTSFSSNTLNTNKINYNYSTIPTFTSSNLGFITTLNYTGSASIAANAFVNVSATLPIGVYIINAYSLFTITTINTNSRVGMNTVINTHNTAYNYSQSLNASTLPQAIQYNFILKNDASTLYYFYYNGGSASTITKFQVNILRIA
jgi:hypothetical protein